MVSLSRIAKFFKELELEDKPTKQQSDNEGAGNGCFLGFTRNFLGQLYVERDIEEHKFVG